MVDRFYEFCGGQSGAWRVAQVMAVVGEGLPLTPFVSLTPIDLSMPRVPAAWSVRGVRSNERYVQARERSALGAVQGDLGRSEAVCAAMIPIRKNAAWWALAQDERRALMEEQSHHIAIGLEYLPAIARRLYHCRDLGEPFDFVTWFEFAPPHVSLFDHMLTRLRSSPEWAYVDREVDIRLQRVGE
jgi:chlorite dismutase